MRRALFLLALGLSGGRGWAAEPSAPPAGEKVPAGVHLKGDAAFKAKAVSALVRIRKTKTGAKLIQELGRAGPVVTVRLGSQESSGAVIYPTGDGDSVILWDPDYELKNSPAFLLLFHELVHALHEARRERSLAHLEEERRTVGLGKFAGDPLSENSLRTELRLPLRTGIDREDFPPSAEKKP